MSLTQNWALPPRLAFPAPGPGSPLGPRGPGWKPHPGIFRSQSADAPVCIHKCTLCSFLIVLLWCILRSTVWSSYLSFVYAIEAVSWCSWKQNKHINRSVYMNRVCVILQYKWSDSQSRKLQFGESLCAELGRGRPVLSSWQNTHKHIREVKN